MPFRLFDKVGSSFFCSQKRFFTRRRACFSAHLRGQKLFYTSCIAMVLYMENGHKGGVPHPAARLLKCARSRMCMRFGCCRACCWPVNRVVSTVCPWQNYQPLALGAIFYLYGGPPRLYYLVKKRNPPDHSSV